MHMQGSPETMQSHPRYKDVVSEVHGFLLERAATATAAGVTEIWLDPGIGFGKTLEHNLTLLRHLPALVSSGLPVVVGTSRKSFLGKIAPGRDGTAAPVNERLEASLRDSDLGDARWCGDGQGARCGSDGPGGDTGRIHPLRSGGIGLRGRRVRKAGRRRRPQAAEC